MTRATAADVIELYSGLRAEGVRVWVDGGWGIDTLLGRQTRAHKDFDAIVAFEDLPTLTRLLERRGFALKLIWEEDRWAPSSELLRRLAEIQLRGISLPRTRVNRCKKKDTMPRGLHRTYVW